MTRVRTVAVAALVAMLVAATTETASANSNPRIDIRSGSDPEQVLALSSLGTKNIHLTLDWSKTEPNGPATDQEINDGNENTAPDWHDMDQKFGRYEDAGINVASLRVTAAPAWATAPSDLDHRGECVTRRCPVDDSRRVLLRRFAERAIMRYGIGGTANYDIPAFNFWNEPNGQNNWAGRRHTDGSHREYARALNSFHNGLTSVTQSVTVGAGEVAEARTEAEGSQISPWSKKFLQYNTDEEWNGNYDEFNMHPFTEEPNQISRMINNYREEPGLRGNKPVNPTAYGWAIDNVRPPQNRPHSCVANEAEQDQKFKNAIAKVRTQTDNVRIMVWFNGVDNFVEFKRSLCWKQHYDRPDCVLKGPFQGENNRKHMNSYGLFQRASGFCPPQGETPNALSDRAIATSFANEQ